jgi:hypothetical protein
LVLTPFDWPKERDMSDDKKLMQASGSDGLGEELAEEKDTPSADRPDMATNPGPFGGGAYPSPHNDPDNADPQNTFMGHGGQSDLGGMGDQDKGPDEDE